MSSAFHIERTSGSSSNGASAAPVVRPKEGKSVHRFRCDKCVAEFQSKIALANHMRIHTPHACDVEGCVKVYPNRALMMSHKEKDHGAGFYCRQCGFWDRNFHRITVHALEHYEQAAAIIYEDVIPL